MSQYLALMYLKDYNTQIQEKLFQSQIMYSQIFSQQITFQLSNEIQKVPLYIRTLNQYLSKLVNNKVKYNPNHISSMVPLEMLHINQVDPQILKVFQRNPILVNLWFQTNYTSVSQLDELGQQKLHIYDRYHVLSRAFQLQDAIKSKITQKTLIINDFLETFEYEALYSISGMNTTIKNQPKIPLCATGIDPRCRFWYIQSSQQESVQMFPPSLIYATQIPSLSSLSCQRMMVQNKTTNQQQLESVVCLELRFNHTQNYFQNYASSTKQVYFIEPQSQILLYDSKKSLGVSSIETLQTQELQFLQLQSEAYLFNQTLNQNYGDLVFKKLDSFNRESLNQVRSFNQTFSYNRNGTQTIVIMNPVYIVDKRPKFENISHDLNSAKYQIKTPYVQINIISDEDLKQHSQQIENFFQTYFLIFNICFGILGLVSILIVILYTIKIKNIFYNTINQLTELLVKMNDQQLSQDIFDLISEDEQLSQETYELYDSFKLIYQIMLQSSEDYYKENETKQLLKLNKNIEFFKQFGNLKAVGTTLNNVGSILLQQGHYFQAMENFQSSIVYAKYEIEQFCNQCPNTTSYNILQQFCYIKKNEYDLNSPKQNKSTLSYAIKANSQFQTSLKERESTKNLEEKSRFSFLKVGGSIKKVKENQQIKKTSYTENNLFDELKEDRNQLLMNLYQRQKNYIISLLAFQEYVDSQNQKMRTNQIQFNFWLEIKKLSKSLLQISRCLNECEFLEIETKILLSKCYFKLKCHSKSEQILFFCRRQLTQLQAKQIKNDNIQFQPVYKNKFYSERRSPQLCYKPIQEFQQKLSGAQIFLQPTKQQLISFYLQKGDEDKNKTFNQLFQSNQLLSFNIQNQTNQKLSPQLKNEIAFDSQQIFADQNQISSQYQNRLQNVSYQSNFRDLEKIFEVFREIDQDQQAKEFFKNYFSIDNIDLLLSVAEAEYFMNQQQDQRAAEILTKLFEEKKSIISHYYFKLVQAIDSIFTKVKIASKDLTFMKQKFNQDTKIQIQMVFSSELESRQIIESLQLTSNLVQKILTSKGDQIGINFVDFSDKCMKTYMPLTQTQQINKFMCNIIKDIVQTVSNPLEYSKLMELIHELFDENELLNINFNNEISSKINSNISRLEVLSKYQFSQQDIDGQQTLNQITNQFLSNHKLEEKQSQETDYQQLKKQFRPSVQLYFEQSKKVKQLSGDFSTDFDLKSYDHVDSESEKAQNKLSVQQNNQFHYFIRNAICQFMNQQLFVQGSSSNEKSTSNTTSNFKYIIYCTDSIQILENRMFELLCKLLFALKIKIIIFSKQKRENFIEQQEDQIYVYKNYEAIRVFYDHQQILNYFDNSRKKFNQNIFPTLIQSY
ncbi:hypothetical protein ABPG74_018426 [Tetrahymena malaccensis]